MQLLVLIFQIPSAFIYFWNVKTYGYIRSISDPFFISNFFIFYLALCSILTEMIVYFNRIYSSYLKIETNTTLTFLPNLIYIFTIMSITCIFLVIYQNTFYFFQVLDDLCLFCVLFFGILWQPLSI